MPVRASRTSSGASRTDRFTGVNESALSELRREYAVGGLDETDLTADPVDMFRRWMHDATVAGLHEPNAMVVATVSAEGAPSSRMVLLKGARRPRLRVLHELRLAQGGRARRQPGLRAAVPLARSWSGRCGSRAWPCGSTTRRARPTSAPGPRGSQVGAWASPQSQVVASRTDLDERYAAAEARFADGEVPRPPYWGGYRIVPEVVEFWQGRRGRMHDRLRYRRDPSGAGWVTERLAP